MNPMSPLARRFLRVPRPIPQRVAASRSEKVSDMARIGRAPKAQRASEAPCQVPPQTCARPEQPPLWIALFERQNLLAMRFVDSAA